MLPFEPLRELSSPWKLLTLALGINLLVVGADYHPAPDWDIPISLIMGFIAYVAYCLRTI